MLALCSGATLFSLIALIVNVDSISIGSGIWGCAVGWIAAPFGLAASRSQSPRCFIITHMVMVREPTGQFPVTLLSIFQCIFSFITAISAALIDLLAVVGDPSTPILLKGLNGMADALLFCK